MKRILAVTLLLMSFASVAMADGPGPIPPVAKPTKPPIAGIIRLADGPGPSARSETDEAAHAVRLVA